MVHNRNIWAFDAVQKCPRRTGDKPETKTVVQKVKDVRDFICVKDHPCKIVETRPNIAAAKRKFVAIDIFTRKVFKATFPESSNCFVPIVTLTDYQLVYIFEDSHVILIDDKGNIKGDLKLPTDQDLLSQIKFEFAEGKDVFVCVASAMGKEQIIASRRRSLLQRY